MRIIHDYFIITIDQRYNTGDGIIKINDAYMEDWAEEHLKYRRQYGVVITLPGAFSDTVTDIVTPGSPEPRLFVSGEYIERLLRMGYTRVPQYNPSTLEKFPEIKLSDIAKKVKVLPKDIVYFDQSVTDPENYLGKHNGQEMYKLRVDQIYCSVRNGQIIPQGGWCFVEPKMETWEEITTPSGIVKKPNPEAVYLEGFVRHIAAREDIKSGDHIIYQRHADYKMTIEGAEYYVMREEDLLCEV